jgi:hypothetical protein
MFETKQMNLQVLSIEDKLQKECKYADSYLQFELTCIDDSVALEAKCVLCCQTVSWLQQN